MRYVLKADFVCIPPENDLQRLKFIRYARQLGFTLSRSAKYRSEFADPEHHTCQGVKKYCARAIAGG